LLDLPSVLRSSLQSIGQVCAIRPHSSDWRNCTAKQLFGWLQAMLMQTVKKQVLPLVSWVSQMLSQH